MMAIFLVCLILTAHVLRFGTPSEKLLSQVQGPMWVAELWCELSEGPVDEGEASSCAPHTDANSSLQTNTAQCHVTNDSGLPASYNSSSNARVVRLGILCWIDENLENLICNLKLNSSQPDTSGLSMSLQHLPSGPGDVGGKAEGREPQVCVGRDVVTCVTGLHALDRAISLTVAVSGCTRSALSPAMRILPWSLMLLEPPVNLQYRMTAEGKVRVNWTAPRPGSALLSCEVRCSTKASLHVPVVRRVSRAEVDLSDLRPGLNYSVQVRCQTPDRSETWSDWSRPLYIYLHEVSYLPERVFANAGSNVTVHCIFNNQSLSARNVVWWLNYHEKVPESQYAIVSNHVSSVTLLNVKPPKQRGYDVLHCCQQRGEKSLCSYPYAQVYVTDFNIAISCETNGDLSSMTCRWNASQWAEVTFLYRRYKMPCDLMEEEVDVALTEMCPLEGRGSNRCTLQDILLASCYLMWLEVKKDEGIIKSRSTHVMPMELVRPHPPFDLNAVTIPDGLLNVRWKRNEFPVYELQYEVRYATDGADAQWKVVGPVFSESAVLPVLNPCLVYTVQVRCRRSDGPGYWSEWSRPCNTTVHNFKVCCNVRTLTKLECPLKELKAFVLEGPDFWRVLPEYPEWNQTNVTLLLKPPPRGKQLFCVEGLEVRHETHEGSVWTEHIGLVSHHTFLWRDEVHSVTVLAVNSLGSSIRNTRMMLNRHAKSRSVRSFSSSLLNRSCVALSWALPSHSAVPTSFVIEWRAGSGSGTRGGAASEAIDWVRVPPTVRAFNLHDAVFALDEYQFVLFPIFVSGEGEPVFSTDNRARPGREHAAFVLLTIVAFLSVVLFVVLTISQRRMRKLVWKDVPNPNNCSWAQGVDFKKAGTIENLFCHSEQLTSHPLLLESETISEAVIVEKAGPPTWDNKKECPRQAPCGDRGGVLGVEAPGIPSCEGSDQSRITYAAVLLAEPPGLLLKQHESLSSSSDEGNFSANVSDISGSFPGGAWELDNGPGCRPLLLRRSCSYNSAEEFSEGSELEDGAQDSAGAARSLCYLRMTSQEEGDEEDSREEEEVGVSFLQDDALRCPTAEQQGLPVESSPLLGHLESQCNWNGVEVSSVPLYMPQFRTSPHKGHSPGTTEQPQQGCPEL